MRGGGFGGDANALRVSYASQVPKDYAGPEYGVRCGM
jgi:hypothetical protein